MSAKGKNSYGVLLVDDSHDDLFFMSRCYGRLSRASIVAQLHDGREAIRYLIGEELFSDRKNFPFPDLMILDLKMPICGALEILQWLRLQPTDRLVVAVVSGSDSPKDLKNCLAAGAHGYWVKASTLDQQTNILQEIETLLDKNRGGQNSVPIC